MSFSANKMFLSGKRAKNRVVGSKTSVFFVELRGIVYYIVHIAQVATKPAYVALLQRVVEYVVTLLPVKIANGDASVALH